MAKKQTKQSDAQVLADEGNGGSGNGSRWPTIALIGTLCATVLLIAFFALNGFYIDVLWFSETGYSQVFFKELTSKLKMGIPLFVAISSLSVLYFRALTKHLEKRKVSRVVEKGVFARSRWAYAIPIAVSAIASVAITNSMWYKWLEFTNVVPSGDVDPIFGLDISFYLFRLPFYQEVVSIAYAMVFVCALATCAISLIHLVSRATGSVASMVGGDLKTLLLQIFEEFKFLFTMFGSAFMLVMAASTYLKRYAILYSTSGTFQGARYTDVNVMKPYYMVIMLACIALGAAIPAFGLRRKGKQLLIAGGAFVLVAMAGPLVSMAYEAWVVTPNQLSLETPYIAHNINFTRKAYGLADAIVRDFPIDTNLTAQDILDNDSTISNIPINDYMPTLDAYNSLQGIRPYYVYSDIDVDRYRLGSSYRQVFISSREMNTSKLDAAAQNWINMHLKYTHGFGISVSPVNEITASGQPVLYVRDIPPVSSYEELEVTQPRIYFGEMAESYAVVGTDAKEFDYPKGNENAEFVYNGNAGIRMSLFNKLSFSLYYGNMKFLLSADVNSDSVILINRNILDRARKIAPFFMYGEDPYIVIGDDGRLFWMLDAMSVSDRYPYSQAYSTNGINYIRNSVKVVIDAYTGQTDFYVVDENDPIVKVYSKIYPNLLKPMSEMPADAVAHLRYSETYFEIQSAMYNSYHMENPTVFYNREDLWKIANQIYYTSNDPIQVNPAYLIMKLPDRASEEFMLMLPFTPTGKDNMVAWMAGLCDGEDYGKLVVYTFPKQEMVYGPMQVERRADQNTDIAPQLALLSQKGSNVLRGNMITVPIENSILYVQAIYIQASSSGAALPEVKMVVASYAEQVVMAPTLNEALASIFGNASRPISQDPDNPAFSFDELSQLALRAASLYDEAQAAMKAGDWVAYGRAMDELGEVMVRIKSLAE